MTVFTPADAAGVQETIAWAAAERQPIEIRGGGSKRALGRPPTAEHVMDLRRVAGIVDYDPSELVLTARAATPMAEVETALDGARQMLAFEPPDLRGVLPSEAAPTLGGLVACNLAGPRRVRAGAARDHFLGFAAVNGWGDAWKAGGRVVKNVTGYDMCKLQAGAMGTLSVLTEVTLRVLPRPETSCSLVVAGLDDEAAVRTMIAALNSPNEVSAAAHLPETVAARVGTGLSGALTFLRLEGHRPSVDHRVGALRTMVGVGERIVGVDSEAAWRRIAGVQTLLGCADSLVWRLCPTPSRAAAVLADIRRAIADVEAFYDWGGGLLWVALDEAAGGADCGAGAVRSAIAAAGGHATLIRAPEAGRARVAPFPPAEGPLGALSRRIKNSFDPNGILNPGRMQEGI